MNKETLKQLAKVDPKKQDKHLKTNRDAIIAKMRAAGRTQ